MAKRKEYTPEYKAKLVIEVFNVKQLGNWKSEFLENAGRAFSRSRDEKSAARQVAELHEKEKKYQAKIGQLTLENAVSNTSLTVWCELPTLTAICR